MSGSAIFALGCRTRKQRSTEQGVHKVRRVSTGDVDTVMCQERQQCSELCSEAGWCGAEAGHDKD